MVRRLLNFEGAVVLASVVYIYFFQIDGSWILFLALILVPDFGLLGYVTRDNRLGSIAYNVTHTYVLSAVLVVSGIASGSQVVLEIGLISAAHIAMDRGVGYGLKYATEPKSTHMQRV
jgi:hypothetical protein